MKPRILFVVNVDWFFLSHRLPIALEAIRNGYEVHVAAAITDRLDVLKGHGLVVHPLVLDRSGMSIVSALRLFVQMCWLFRLVRPNLVHLVTIKPVVLGGIAARLLRVPAVVVAISGLGFVFLAQGWLATIRRSLIGVLYRFALGHSNLKVVFQNQDDQSKVAKMTGLSAWSTELIRGSGVDLTQYRFALLPTDGLPVVMLAGRLLVDKGVREFLLAAKRLKNAGVVARFVLVGTVDPENPSSLSDQELLQWADDGVVELWGKRPDMPQVLAESHIVVLPSYREGLPKVLIEAAACGRVVVTTDVPGCRDAILPGVTGFLVPIYDDRLLAETIAKLLENRSLCESMGKAGRGLAEQVFDVRQVVSKHLQIYGELLERVK